MLETKFNKDDTLVEVGLDEAGRGPFVGRLYVGAVIWPMDVHSSLVKDSKKLSTKRREHVYDYIKDTAIDYSVEFAEIDEIDKYGVGYAGKRAMHRAISKLCMLPDYIVVDGTENMFDPYCDSTGEFINYTTVEKGDNKYYSVAAASILAKVEHDRYITKLCEEHPELEKYDIKNNMGYGSLNHRNAIKEYGFTAFHRRSFSYKFLDS